MPGKSVRHPIAFVSLLGALCMVAAQQGCTPHHDDGPTCESPYLTDAAWVGVVGVGGGIGWAGDPGYYYGDFFDPGDDYDPSVPEPPGGWDSADSSGTGDVGDLPGDVPGDTGGDVPAGDDTGGDIGGDGVSTDGKGRLVIQSAPPTSVTAPDANGCYACTVGCWTGTDASAVGRQAVGASGRSYDSACRAGVRAIEQWAHDTHSRKIVGCQQIGPAASTARTPAAPTVTPAPGRCSRRTPTRRSAASSR